MATQPLSLTEAMIPQLEMTHVDEEVIIMEQAMATHDPSGAMDVDANSLINFADAIFNFNTVPREAIQKHIKKEISLDILHLSFTIAFACLNNDDNHSTAIHILSLLSKYMWHAKAVMVLTSFAIIHGKFKVVSKLCHWKGLTYNMAALKKVLNPMLSSDDIENLVNDSTKSMLDLTKLMVELQHSSSMILANYWIARYVVAYVRLHILGIESQNQLIEQSILSTKIEEIITSSHPLLEAKRAEEKYEGLLHAFENSSNILEILKLIFNVKYDNEKPILYTYRVLPRPCPVGLDEFEGEGVLLLISSAKHFPYYAYNVPRGVKMIWVPIINDYVEEHIPMPDRSFSYYRVLDPQRGIATEFLRYLKDKCFPTFQVGGDPIAISLDNRGRLVHSNALHMVFIWGYQLSNEGTTRSGNIIPSLKDELRKRTFGADRVIGDIDKQILDFASEVHKKINDWVKDIKTKMRSSFRSYNYTSEREEALWNNEESYWSLKLVVGRHPWSFSDTLSGYISSSLNYWIDHENYIFLCGGNNIKQVQEFALKVQEVRSKFQMNMKIAYIGRTRKMTQEMMRSACDYVFVQHDFKYFWARLHNIASSRIQYLSKVGHDEGSDEILQGLRKVLAYVDEATTIGAWALLSKGKRIIACDVGDKMLGVMNEYEKWKDNANTNGFDHAFKDYYEMLNCSSSSSSSNPHPCCALNHPSNLDKIPEAVSCPQCSHNMHKFVTFSCCHGPTNYLYYRTDEDY